MKWFWDGNLAKIYLWTDRFSSSNGWQFLFQMDSPTVRTDNNFLKRIAQAVQTDNNFWNGYPKPFEQITIFSKRTAQAVQTDDINFFFGTDSRSKLFKRTTIFSKQIAQAVRMDDNFFGTDTQMPNPFKNSKTFFNDRVTVIRGSQRQFSKNICSEGDLRSRIFRTFVVKFLACLPLLGFSNI